MRNRLPLRLLSLSAAALLPACSGRPQGGRRGGHGGGPRTGEIVLPTDMPVEVTYSYGMPAAH